MVNHESFNSATLPCCVSHKHSKSTKHTLSFLSGTSNHVSFFSSNHRLQFHASIYNLRPRLGSHKGISHHNFEKHI
jgi:hypothetical protein